MVRDEHQPSVVNTHSSTIVFSLLLAEDPYSRRLRLHRTMLQHPHPQHPNQARAPNQHRVRFRSLQDTLGRRIRIGTCSRTRTRCWRDWVYDNLGKEVGIIMPVALVSGMRRPCRPRRLRPHDLLQMRVHQRRRRLPCSFRDFRLGEFGSLGIMGSRPPHPLRRRS